MRCRNRYGPVGTNTDRSFYPWPFGTWDISNVYRNLDYNRQPQEPRGVQGRWGKWASLHYISRDKGVNKLPWNGQKAPLPMDKFSFGTTKGYRFRSPVLHTWLISLHTTAIVLWCRPYSTDGQRQSRTADLPKLACLELFLAMKRSKHYKGGIFSHHRKHSRQSRCQIQQ